MLRTPFGRLARLFHSVGRFVRDRSCGSPRPFVPCGRQRNHHFRLSRLSWTIAFFGLARSTSQTENLAAPLCFDRASARLRARATAFAAALARSRAACVRRSMLTLRRSISLHTTPTTGGRGPFVFRAELAIGCSPFTCSVLYPPSPFGSWGSHPGDPAQKLTMPCGSRSLPRSLALGIPIQKRRGFLSDLTRCFARVHSTSPSLSRCFVSWSRLEAPRDRLLSSHEIFGLGAVRTLRSPLLALTKSARACLVRRCTHVALRATHKRDPLLEARLLVGSRLLSKRRALLRDRAALSSLTIFLRALTISFSSRPRCSRRARSLSRPRTSRRAAFERRETSLLVETMFELESLRDLRRIPFDTRRPSPLRDLHESLSRPAPTSSETFSRSF